MSRYNLLYRDRLRFGKLGGGGGGGGECVTIQSLYRDKRTLA